MRVEWGSGCRVRLPAERLVGEGSEVVVGSAAAVAPVGFPRTAAAEIPLDLPNMGRGDVSSPPHWCIHLPLVPSLGGGTIGTCSVTAVSTVTLTASSSSGLPLRRLLLLHSHRVVLFRLAVTTVTAVTLTASSSSGLLRPPISTSCSTLRCTRSSPESDVPPARGATAVAISYLSRSLVRQ